MEIMGLTFAGFALLFLSYTQRQVGALEAKLGEPTEEERRAATVMPKVTAAMGWLGVSIAILYELTPIALDLFGS